MEINFLGYNPCSSPFLIKPSPDMIVCAHNLPSVNLSSFVFYSNLGVRVTFPQQTFWLSTPFAWYVSSFIRDASLAPVPSRQGSYGSPEPLRPPLKCRLKEPFITYASDDFLCSLLVYWVLSVFSQPLNVVCFSFVFYLSIVGIEFYIGCIHLCTI